MYVTNGLEFLVASKHTKRPIQGKGDDFSRVFQSLMSNEATNATTKNISGNKSLNQTEKQDKTEMIKELEEKTGLPAEVLEKFLDLLLGQKLIPQTIWNKWEYRLDEKTFFANGEAFNSTIGVETNLSLNTGLFFLSENSSFKETFPLETLPLINLFSDSHGNIQMENLVQFFSEISNELTAGTLNIEKLMSALERILEGNQFGNSLRDSVSNGIGQLNPTSIAQLLHLMDRTVSSQDNQLAQGEVLMAMEETTTEPNKSSINGEQILRQAFGDLPSKDQLENEVKATEIKEHLRNGLIQEAESNLTGAKVQRNIPTLTVPQAMLEPLEAESGLKGKSFEQFAKEFSSILQRSAFLHRGATKKIFVRLYPEHLGMVKIELTQTDQGLAAKIVASTQRAKEILESQLHGLRQALIQQNLEVNRLDLQGIWQEEQELLNYHGNPGQQEQPEDGKKDEERGPQENAESFRDILVNYKI